MSNKSHKQRVEEQKTIFDFVDRIIRYSNVAECEGVGSPLKITRHDGYTYSMTVNDGKKLMIRFEISDPKEGSVPSVP